MPDLTLETIPDPPQNRTAHCRENLRAALALADDLLKQQRMTPAAVLGHIGGSVTSRKLGVEHYRKMAAARKTRGGGRPRKEAEQPGAYLKPSDTTPVPFLGAEDFAGALEILRKRWLVDRFGLSRSSSNVLEHFCGLVYPSPLLSGRHQQSFIHQQLEVSAGEEVVDVGC